MIKLLLLALTAGISPKLWLVGVPVLIALFIHRPGPLLVLMAVMAAPQVWKAWKALRGQLPPEEAAYYIASSETRLSYGALYLGLMGFLALMCQDLQKELPRVF